MLLSRIRRGERVENFETVRRRKDGTLVPISLTCRRFEMRTASSSARRRLPGTSRIADDRRRTSGTARASVGVGRRPRRLSSGRPIRRGRFSGHRRGSRCLCLPTATRCGALIRAARGKLSGLSASRTNSRRAPFPPAGEHRPARAVLRPARLRRRAVAPQRLPTCVTLTPAKASSR